MESFDLIQATRRPTLWVMGGLDPWGAAGIAVDLRVASLHPVHVCPLITRITNQSLTTYDEAQQLDNPLFLAQCEMLKKTHPPHAVKIGMLGSEAQWDDLLAGLPDPKVPLILDPILATSSGSEIVCANVLAKVTSQLLPRVTLVTPNKVEAEVLAGRPIDTADDIIAAAEEILAFGPQGVYIKGGHWQHSLNDHHVIGYYRDLKQSFWLVSKRQAYECRGTGCGLSSLIAAEMALGGTLADSVVAGQGLLNTAFEGAYYAGQLETLRLLPASSGRSVTPWLYPQPTTEKAVLGRGARTKIQPYELKFHPDRMGFYPIVPSLEWLRRLADAGAKTIQLRIKALHDEPLQGAEAHSKQGPLGLLIGEAVAFAKSRGLALYINDYWSLALEYQAYGVHLGQEDLDTIEWSDLARLSKTGMRLGVSTHSEVGLARALPLKPSYVALGPIFPTTCKSMAYGPHGLAKIRRWRQMTDLPLVAIGGMTPGSISSAVHLGADGVAVISDILCHPFPERRCQHWIAGFASGLGAEPVGMARNFTENWQTPLI